MHHVILNPRYILRGWSDLAYGIYDLDRHGIEGKVRRLSRKQKDAIELLTAPGIAADDPLIPVWMKEFAQTLYDEGILQDGEKHAGLLNYQKYRSTKARFIHTLLWSITGHCNLRCRHCYVSAGNRAYGELPFEKCKQIVRQMLDANIHMVALTGGEPLVRKDFWPLVDLLLENHIHILQVFTNGVCVTEHFLDEFDRRQINPNEFMVSFDGVGCHDWLRGVPGTEEKTLAAIRRIKAHGYEVLAITSVHMGNVDSLMATYERMKELQVDSWQLSPIVDTGNWRSQENRAMDYPYIFAQYLRLLERYKADRMPLRLMLGGFFQGTKGSEEYTTPFTRGCGTCRRSRELLCNGAKLLPYLLPDGRFLPCITMSATAVESDAPNILDEGESLENALGDSPISAYAKYTYEDLFAHNAECRECEHRFLCSGCRANALAQGGYFAKDMLACCFLKGNYAEKIAAVMAH